jgi:DNA polymerase-3 subunit epsilon
MVDINWKEEDISSHKLEYIAYKYNFFFEGHRAIIDCLAGIHILSQELPNSNISILKQLLDNAGQLRFKLWATNSPYESKDLLKARGYRWSNPQTDKHKAWFIELTEDKVAEEINYLRSNVYGSSAINIPVEIFLAPRALLEARAEPIIVVVPVLVLFAPAAPAIDPPVQLPVMLSVPVKLLFAPEAGATDPPVQLPVMLSVPVEALFAP